MRAHLAYSSSVIPFIHLQDFTSRIVVCQTVTFVIRIRAVTLSKDPDLRNRILDPDLCPLVTCRYILVDTMHIQFDLDTLTAVEEGEGGEGGDKTVLKLQKNK